MLNKNFCVRLIVILLLVASFQVMLADDSPPDISDWLANHAIPFLTDDPEGDLRDLAPLTEVIGEARIV